MTNWEAYAEGMAGPVGLVIAPEYRAGVARFLAIAAEMAAVLETVELDDAELDLAPVYSLPESPE